MRELLLWNRIRKRKVEAELARTIIREEAQIQLASMANTNRNSERMFLLIMEKLDRLEERLKLVV